jgi:hypothetical protein
MSPKSFVTLAGQTIGGTKFGYSRPLSAVQAVRAEVELSHRADRELIRGWGPTG